MIQEYILLTPSHEVVFCSFVKTWAAWIGKKIKDSMSDAKTSTATAIGISFMTSPMVPDNMSAGIKANRVVSEAIVTGLNISFAPTTAASLGGIPSSICCCIFSLTTMASSTMIPRAISTPMSEIILIVYPEA